ncbi:MAG: hypothetical protein Q9207_008002 [Kuettlingeria erythrocarpa]
MLESYPLNPSLNPRGQCDTLHWPSSPINSPPSAGSSTARPSSPPGGAKTAIRRKAAADRADKVANARPASTRAAGAGGSTSTMLSELEPQPRSSETQERPQQQITM